MRQELRIHIEGTMKLYELPEGIREEEMSRYWQSLSIRQREALQKYEYHNLITNGGLAAISAYLGAYTNTSPGFAQYLAFGTGVLNGVSASDTSLTNEVVRYAPASSSVTGNQTDITVNLPPLSTSATYTEAGLYTGSASSTLNSGTLASHLLCTVPVVAYHAYVCDYILVRS